VNELVVRGRGEAASIYREMDMPFWLEKAEAELREH